MPVDEEGDSNCRSHPTKSLVCRRLGTDCLQPPTSSFEGLAARGRVAAAECLDPRRQLEGRETVVKLVGEDSAVADEEPQLAAESRAAPSGPAVRSASLLEQGIRTAGPIRLKVQLLLLRDSSKSAHFRHGPCRQMASKKLLCAALYGMSALKSPASPAFPEYTQRKEAADHGLGLDNPDRAQDGRKESVQPDQQQAVRIRQPRSLGHLAHEDIELLAEYQILGSEPSARFHPRAQRIR